MSTSHGRWLGASSWPSLRRAGAILGLASLAFAPVVVGEEPPPVPAPAPAPAPTPAPEGGGAPAVPPAPPVAPGAGTAANGLRVGREAMWPAPTADDWKKPCLITWQRTWEDAQAVSKETGRPILVCINMDGEIASEHYAGVRYRQPEIAALYEPYVTVIASVYRHTPRDFDEQGRRILCPRFGSVTCAEHIAMETAIYDKYEHGQRVAPRHVGVELDGSEIYNVFYANDTASVFQFIKDGIAKRAAPPPVVVRSDRPIVERVESRAIQDRLAVEAAYQQGDAGLRKSLLEAAAKHPEAASLDLLRLALFGLDVDAARLARQALAQVKSSDATDLIVEALRVPMDPADRAALLAALGKLGESSPRARWLAVVQQGLSAHSTEVDDKGWTPPAGDAKAPLGPDWDALEAKLRGTSGSAKAAPEDPATDVELAETSLALAFEAPRTFEFNPRMATMFARHMFAGARRYAQAAEKLGATGWRANTVLALTSYYTGDVPEAYARAALAVKEIPAGEPSWRSMALLTVFAESRWKAIKKAVREQQPWPPSWLSDVNAAYTVLRRHPLGTDGQAQWHYDFLMWLGANEPAGRALHEGLARFPDSRVLHERLRERTIAEKGPAGLEAAYDALLVEKGSSASLESFAGLASVAAGDHERRAARYDAALASYGRAIAHYERAALADAAWKALADESIALALSGRARVAYQVGNDDLALTEMLASLERGKTAAGTRDGVGITPGETAQMLLARLRTANKADQAAKLEAALAKVDPELLRPDRE